ncbi:hypothetical protein [Geoglobus sp.]
MRLLVILMALLLLGCAGSTDVGEKSAGTSPTPCAQEQSEQGVNASKLLRRGAPAITVTTRTRPVSLTGSKSERMSIMDSRLKSGALE